MITVRNMVRLARPGHWIKNAIVLLPVIFALRGGDPDAWFSASLAAGALCLAASCIYIINDICDRACDRLHPAKKDRPLASGQIGVGAALVESALLFAGAMALAALTGWVVTWLVVAYVLLQIAYTFVFKRRAIIDVICIALGFVLRAVAGAAAINVEISPWLIICTFTICMFLGFCKRRNESATLGESDQAQAHRSTLGDYSESLLTHLITLSAAIAVVSFLLYASSERTANNLGTIYLIYTLPIVVYAVCRFAMLSMRGRYADPMDIMQHDWPMQLTAAAWIIAVVTIIHWGPAVQLWFESQG